MPDPSTSLNRSCSVPLKASEAIDDLELTFFMQVYQDQQQALKSLGQVRKVYPGARIIVRFDGAENNHPGHFEGLGVHVFCEERYFLAQNGGLAIQRMFELWSEASTALLIKIDPDTFVRRRFKLMPTIECVFGTPNYGKPVSIQGGCMGFTAGSAETILNSNLLIDGRLRTLSIAPEFSSILRRRAQEFGLASFDWSIGWACSLLNIPQIDHPEVNSGWKDPARDERDSAIVHPFKWTSLDQHESSAEV